MTKPHGIHAARKLLKIRKTNRWADKDWKKRNLGTRWKSNPFQGSSHAKGIVVEKMGIEAKQPNSAIRKCCRVQLIKNGWSLVFSKTSKDRVQFMQLLVSVKILFF